MSGQVTTIKFLSRKHRRKKYEKNEIGKKMGLADCFSRRPTANEFPPSKEDKNIVINLFDSFKFLLNKANKI